MKITTIVGLFLHILAAVVWTVICGVVFLGKISLTSMTDMEFMDKFTASIRSGIIISALIYLIWQFIGLFLYKNDIWNSKFNMKRNWWVLFIVIVLLQIIPYSILINDYSAAGLYGLMLTVSIFLIPASTFWLATATASPSLFKYSAPWSRKVRYRSDILIYKNITSRS